MSMNVLTETGNVNKFVSTRLALSTVSVIKDTAYMTILVLVSLYDNYTLQLPLRTQYKYISALLSIRKLKIICI